MGLCRRNRRFVLEEIRRSLPLLKADVIFLQEVVGRNDRHQKTFGEWPTSGQLEFLAADDWNFTLYGKNAAYEDGHHGNAILSSLPLHETENIDISAPNAEARGLLYCTLAGPAASQSPSLKQKLIHCFCTHLGISVRERREQFHRMLEAIKGRSSAEDAIILAGDFNDWQRMMCRPLRETLGCEEAFKELHRRLPRTFPARIPLLSLDRIYTRGFRVQHAEIPRGRPWNSLSDHLPLLVELEPLNE